MKGAGLLLASAFLAMLCGAPLAAFEPELPHGARLTGERQSEIDSFDAPIGVFDGTSVPLVTQEGRVLRRAWRIEARELTPLQVILPLRDQLEVAGFDLVFECDASDCGGFDFRFGIEVLPGPNMYVNIARYRYLTARRGDPDAPEEVIGVLASVTTETAYVQIISAARDFDRAALLPDTRPAPLAPEGRNDRGVVANAQPVGPDALEERLRAQGHVVLEDLDFAPGTSDLGSGPFGSLEALARLLNAQPQLRIALVGHTDTVGDLNANIAVSRARARSVRDRIVSQFSIDGSRLDAEGMGYLAPVASNLTEEGRTANRRVEAVLLDAQ